jgi:hypothetical protein
LLLFDWQVVTQTVVTTEVLKLDASSAGIGHKWKAATEALEGLEEAIVVRKKKK